MRRARRQTTGDSRKFGLWCGEPRNHSLTVVCRMNASDKMNIKLQLVAAQLREEPIRAALHDAFCWLFFHASTTVAERFQICLSQSTSPILEDWVMLNAIPGAQVLYSARKEE